MPLLFASEVLEFLRSPCLGIPKDITYAITDRGSDSEALIPYKTLDVRHNGTVTTGSIIEKKQIQYISSHYSG